MTAKAEVEYRPRPAAKPARKGERMTTKDYRELRNRLMAQACTLDKTIKEYGSINKRIAYINRKLWEVQQ